MTSALPPTSPLASASLHEDDTLLPIVLHRPRADMLTTAMTHAVAEVASAVERQYVDHILTSRDGSEGVSAHLQRRGPVWEDR